MQGTVVKVLVEVAHHVKRRGGRVRVNTDGLANRVHKRNVLPALANAPPRVAS